MKIITYKLIYLKIKVDKWESLSIESLFPIILF